MRKPVDTFLKQGLQCAAYDVESEPEYHHHYAEEGRDSGVFSRQDVNTLRTAMLLALLRMLDRKAAEARYEGVSHICHCSGAVESTLLLHLAEDMLDGLLLIGREFQRIDDERVALHEFCGSKADRYSRRFSMVFDEVHDSVKAAMHCASIVILRAEVLYGRAFLIASDVYGMVYQFGDTLILSRGDRHYRDSEHRLHDIDVDTSAVAFQFIHHIDGKDYRHIQLHELHSEVEISLYIISIHDIDDTSRTVIEYEITAYHLFAGVRREAVDAWQVSDVGALVPTDGTVFSVHGHTWEVSHVLIGAGKLIEERRLAAVLVAHEGESEGLALRKRRLMRRIVVHSRLSDTRVMGACRLLFRWFRDYSLLLNGIEVDGLYVNLLSVSEAQGQLIAFHLHSGGRVIAGRRGYDELHRVAHRGIFLECQDRAWDDSHIKEVLAEGAFASYSGHYC